jgi:hypothetical protein
MINVSGEENADYSDLIITSYVHASNHYTVPHKYVQLLWINLKINTILTLLKTILAFCHKKFTPRGKPFIGLSRLGSCLKHSCSTSRALHSGSRAGWKYICEANTENIFMTSVSAKKTPKN